jgi:hypothetical protein
MALMLILMMSIFCGTVIFTASAQSVDITVTIQRVTLFEDPDPGDGAFDGDLYAEAQIGNEAVQASPTLDNYRDISPHWTFTRTLDLSDYPVGAVPITLSLWDSDLVTDDILDLNPADNIQKLFLSFDPATNTWAGTTANSYSKGDGDSEHFGIDEGGEQSAMIFYITTSSNGDTDEDGIPDGVELDGIYDTNGNLVTDMAALGADPCRKTVAVEIDYMTGHLPMGAAMNEAIQMFNNAPVDAVTSCPYAGFPRAPTGVDLLVDVDDTLTEQPVFSCEDFDAIFKFNHFGPERALYFHYNVWAHKHDETSSSGVACGRLNEKDFIVSLGGFSNQVGTTRDQSGTFVHELGHTLGLGHGGGDGVNYKPNYLSVMSYTFQNVGLTNTAGSRIDYSREVLPTLNELDLRETRGISDGLFLTLWTTLTGNGMGVGVGPMDWTGTDVDGDGIYRMMMVSRHNADVCVNRIKWQLKPLPRTNSSPDQEITDGPNRQCDNRQYHSRLGR